MRDITTLRGLWGKITGTVRASGYGDAGASHTRKSLKGYKARSISPREDIDQHNYTLRQRSRSLQMSSPLAASAVNTNRTNVVGVGLKLRCRVNRKRLGLSDHQAEAWESKTQEEWEIWASDKRACDATGINNFYGLQQLAFSSSLVSGDIFGLFKEYETCNMYPYKLRIHLIEADRVSTPSSSRRWGYPYLTTGEAENGNTIYDGVEVDRNGRVVAYYICDQYPDQLALTLPKWTRVEAYGKTTGMPNILHVMSSERPDQYRGVSYLAPIIEQVLQLKRYTDAETTAAVVESFFTAFIKNLSDPSVTALSETNAEDEVSDHENEYEMGPGNIIQLAPGQDVEFGDPKRPGGGFEGFVRALSEQMGAALELPADLLLKSFNKAYSASRSALMEAWKAFRMRRRWFVDDFCQPAYTAWLSEAISSGRIKAPGFFTDPIIRAAWLGTDWIGPSQGQLDPSKEIKAELLAINEGLTTREQATIKLNGGSWEDNIAQLKRENELLSHIRPQTSLITEEPDDEGEGGESN